MSLHQARSHSNSPKGQYIVEVLVALGVFVVFAAALSSLVLDASLLLRTTSAQYQAEWFLREGREAVYSIKQQGWDKLPIGTFGLSRASGLWELAAQPDIQGSLTRSVVVEWVTRDSLTQDISHTGDIDIQAKRVTFTLTDTDTGSRLAEETIIHTLPLAHAWTETTIADFSDGTFFNTQTAVLDDGGVTLTTSGETASGFPYVADSTVASASLSRQQRKLSYRFTPPDFAPITSIRIYVANERNAPTYRVGLQSSNAQGNPNGTWLGTTNQGFGTIQPTTIGWHEITLTEPVQLSAGTQAHLVIEWAQGSINNQRSMQLLLTSPSSFIDPTTGTFDANRAVLYSSNGTSWTTTQHDPVFILSESSGSSIGNAYTNNTTSQIYDSRSIGQRFVVGQLDTLITKVRFLIAYGQQQPTGDLLVSVKDVTDNLVLGSATIATPQSTSRNMEWKEADLGGGITLPAYHHIRLELSSPGSAQNRPYLTPTDSVNFLSPYLEVSFSGTQSFAEISAPNGAWIGSPVQDIPFQVVTQGGPAASGEYLSSIFDTQSASTRPVAINWNGTALAGSTLGVQIRVGQSLADIASQAWQGPGGTDQTVFETRDEIILPPGVTGQLLQYKILFTSNGVSAPEFTDITILYE